MASLVEFGTLRAKFSGLADFASIYISEAHPKERPNFSGNLDIGTHIVLEDRMNAARALENTMDGEDNTILVDNMDNKARAAYAALPERLYVVLDGEVVLEVRKYWNLLIINFDLQGKTGPFGYNLADVESYLDTFCPK